MLEHGKLIIGGQKFKYQQFFQENIAVYLSYNDVDRIKDLIEKVIQCLLRHCEGQLKVLHEIITNRKSRSLFSGAKRWFGQSKPGVASGTSVIYGREAPELQLRKLADLYFMFKLYKPAYHHYHTAKKDFQVIYYSPYFLSMKNYGKRAVNPL